MHTLFFLLPPTWGRSQMLSFTHDQSVYYLEGGRQFLPLRASLLVLELKEGLDKDVIILSTRCLGSLAASLEPKMTHVITLFRSFHPESSLLNDCKPKLNKTKAVDLLKGLPPWK